MTAVDVLARILPSLGLIVGALLVLRHWAQRGRSGSTDGVRVLTRTGIAKGAVVAVVAVGERRLLVGASEHGVHLLTELDADATTTTSNSLADIDLTATDAPAGVEHAAADALAGVDLTAGEATDRLSPAPRFGLRSVALPWTTDRPRMAPIDRLRHLTVRRAVPSHPRSNGAKLRS